MMGTGRMILLVNGYEYSNSRSVNFFIKYVSHTKKAQKRVIVWTHNLKIYRITNLENN